MKELPQGYNGHFYMIISHLPIGVAGAGAGQTSVQLSVERGVVGSSFIEGGVFSLLNFQA